MQSEGLRGTQFSILVVLSFRGPETVTKLSEHLLMDRTTLTRNLRPLERLGLIKITPGGDLRVKRVALTHKGMETMEKTFPLWERAQSTIINKIGKKRFHSLIRDLSEISLLFSGKTTGV
jgi:DNA-binding MarR family transcriptional regulator